MRRIQLPERLGGGEERVRATRGKLRMFSAKRFRGAGLGKHSYPDGKNPARAAHGGRIPD